MHLFLWKSQKHWHETNRCRRNKNNSRHINLYNGSWGKGKMCGSFKRSWYYHIHHCYDTIYCLMFCLMSFLIARICFLRVLSGASVTVCYTLLRYKIFFELLYKSEYSNKFFEILVLLYGNKLLHNIFLHSKNNI